MYFSLEQEMKVQKLKAHDNMTKVTSLSNQVLYHIIYAQSLIRLIPIVTKI